MAVIGNAPFQGLVSGGNILDASIEGVDLSTSAIAARLGYTPVDPGAAVFSANPTISSGTANGIAYLNASKVVSSSSNLTFNGTTLTVADFTDSSLTAGRVVYAGTGGNLTDSASLTFNGTTLTASNVATTGVFQLSTNAAQAAGSIAKNATYGVSIYGITGTSYDITLLNNAGNVALGVTTATQNLVTGNNLLVTGTLNANTAIRVGAASLDELFTINGSSAGFIARITNSTATNPNGLYVNSTNAIGTGTAFRVDSAGTSLLTLNTTGLTLAGNISVGGTAQNYFAGNVSIGAVSSSYKLTVAGTSGTAIISLLETGVRSWGIRAGGTATNTFDIADFTAGATRLTIDASGNLGFGTIPSAFGGGRWMQFLSTTTVGQQQNGTANIICNAYESSANTFSYIVAAAASRYNAQVGSHAWFIAPTGVVNSTTITSGVVYVVAALGSSTLVQWQAFFSALTVLPTVGQSITATATGTLAGGGTVTQTISFTQAMTLNASGQLGIGTPSPTVKLDIAGAETAVTQLIWARGNNDASFVSSLRTGDAGTTAYQSTIGVDYAGFTDFSRIKFYRASTLGEIHFFTGGLTSNGSERMRLTSTELNVTGVIRSKSGTTGTLYLGTSTGGTTYVAAALVGTPSTLYAPIGRLSFQLPTHGANTDYGLTEQMFIEGTGADSRGAYKISMLPNGGNVGINTTTPATPFVVSNAGAQGVEITPASGAIQVYNRSTSAYGTMNLYANTLYIRTGASPAINVTVDVSGNVGIGNSLPTNPLTVNATGNAAYISSKGLVVDHSSSSTSVVIPIGFSWSNSISTQNPYWGMGLVPVNYSSGTAALGFYIGGNEVSRFSTAGNLALGTQNNTSYKLNVNGSIWLLGNDDANYSAVIAARYDSTWGFTMQSRLNSGTMSEFLGVYADSGGAAPRLSLVGGNGWKVGIGTTSALGKLEVAAGADNQHIRIADYNHDASSSTFRYPALSYYARRDNSRYNGVPLSDGGSTASIVFTDRPGTAGYPTNCRTSDIEFWTATNTGGTGLDPRPAKRVIITAEGNVVIGTTTTTGDVSNIAELYAGRFRTVTGTVSVPTGTVTTLLTVPSQMSSWMIAISANTDDANNYSAVVSVNTQYNNATKVTVLVPGGQLTFSMSGYSLRVLQGSGGTISFTYSAQRIL